MIMWKKYYSRKIKKIKYTENYNEQIPIMSICNYLNLNVSFVHVIYKPIKFKKFFMNIKNQFYIKKVKKYLNEKLQKYLKTFLNTIFVLENIKTTFYQSCFNILSKYFFQNRDFLVFYVIYLNFSKSNITLQVTDSIGNSKGFYSAGLMNLKGKQKFLRRLVLIRFFNLLTLLKLKFIKNFPVALHLKNVGSNRFLIIRKLKKRFFTEIIKIFELNAYNGCRKKKERRKRQK